MNLLITGALQKDESFFSEIEKIGYRIDYVPDERKNEKLLRLIFCNF